ncbi:coatomer subunit beta-like, partial [Cyclospora cayetanensis]|uniref:Coatomer subunit beta-like n=1 Tax=Cyclospora cayetanensis TaxID=88456 RepID=A0A6P6S033_9EIME
PEGTSTLREAIVGGDALLAAVVSICLTKLLLLSSPEYFARRRQQRLAAAAVTPAGSGNRGGEGKENLCVSEDCLRIPPCGVLQQRSCVRSVSGQTSDAAIRCNQALRTILCLIRIASVDSSIPFRLLLPVTSGETAQERRAFDEEAFYEASEDEDDWQEQQQPQAEQQQSQQQSQQQLYDLQPDVAVAVGEKSPLSEASLFHQRLRSVQQLTGLADEVYVEAFLRLNQFDLLLELLVVNRTNETLYNVNVELAAQGDVRLVDRPAALTLPPFASVCCFSSLKLKSAEGAVLFGVVSLERKGSQHSGRQYILLAELSLDCLPFVHPTWIEPSEFRRRWQEFEWENKLQVLTPPTSVLAFLEALLKETKMTVVGSKPPSRQPHKLTAAAAAAAAGDATLEEFEMTQQSLQQMKDLQKLAKACSVFSVNLYSRSVFGEDALANLSLEKLRDGRLSGSVRVRSRTQGIALSVGDKITSLQRRAAAEC